MRAAGGVCYALAALSCLAALASIIVGPDGTLELAWGIVPLVLAAASGIAGRRLRARAERH
jgi:hypothetical protein